MITPTLAAGAITGPRDVGPTTGNPAMSETLFGEAPKTRKAIGAHESATTGTDTWLTPPSIIHALGHFDLDPASPISRPWDTATRHYDARDDGLTKPWTGRVWLNPPYRTAGAWLARMADHGDGVSLVFARTETRAWQEHVWPHATAMLFMAGRLRFCYPDGRQATANAGAPSVLIAYGAANAAALKSSGIPGAYVEVNS